MLKLQVSFKQLLAGSFLLLMPLPLGGQTSSLLLSQYPRPGQTGVPRNASLVFTFDAAVGFGEMKVTLREPVSSTEIALDSVGSWSDQAFIERAFRPRTPLAAMTTYTVNIGSPLFPAPFIFTTGSELDQRPPNLVGISPPEGTVIDPGGPIRIEFDEPLLTWFGFLSVTEGLGSPLLTFAQMSADRRTVELRLSAQSPVHRVVKIGLAASALNPPQDIAGNRYAGKFSAQFLTTAAGDGSGPRLLGSYPENGAVDVPTNAAIQMLFDRPIYNESLQRGGISVEARGQAVTLGQGVGANGSIVLVGGLSLLPNTQYRVRVNEQVTDTNGLPVGQATTIEFATGAAPLAETTEPAKESPQGLAPLNTRFAVRSPRPLPAYLPLVFTNVGPESFLSPAQNSIAVTAALSEDARTLILTPRDPLPARTTASIGLRAVLDITGQAPFQSLIVTTGVEIDTAAPKVTFSTPVDGSTGVSPNTPFRVLFSEPLGLITRADALRLRTNGQRVDGEVTINGSALEFKPKSPLAGDQDYTLEAVGVSDFAGNVMQPWSASFRTAPNSARPSTGLRVLRSSIEFADPADTDPIEVEFSGPLAAGHTVVNVNAGGPYVGPFRYEIAGARVRLIPLIPWPSGRAVSLGVSTQDSWGQAAYYSAVFRAVSNDTAAPEVVSLDPPAGTPLRQGSAIRVRFSEPMFATTDASPVVAMQGEFKVTATTEWSDDRRMATISLAPLSVSDSAYLPGQLGLVLGSDFTDVAGNPLKTVVAQYPMLRAAVTTGGSAIISSWPAAEIIDRRSPITFYLRRPVDAAAMNREVLVFTGQGRAAGAWTVSADGLVATFRPDTLWPASSFVRLAQVNPVLDLPYGWSVRTAAVLAGLAVTRTTLATSSMPANQVMEVEFNQEPPAGPLFDAELTQNSLVTILPVEETMPRPRVRRVTARTALSAGQMVALNFREGIPVVGSRYLGSVRLTAPLPATPVTPRFRAPYPGAEGVPRNARVSVVFTDLLNPLSVTDATVKVTANGVPVAVQYSTESTLFGPLTLTPLEPLPGNAEVEVRLEGVEDLVGRVVEPVAWRFRTGDEIDKTAPKLLYSNVPGSTGSQSFAPQFDPQAPLRLTYDEPIDPASLLQPNSVATSIELSGDLRTISIIPVGGWPRGLPGNISLSPRDWSGNLASGSVPSLIAAFDSDRSPLTVRATSPRNGQAGIPLNVRFAVLFNKPMGAEALKGMRLVGGGKEIGLMVATGDQSGRTQLERVLFRPEVPLQPFTDYVLLVDGVEDAGGRVLGTPWRIGFRTGGQYDTTQATVVGVRGQAIGQPVRVQVSEALDPTGLPGAPNLLTWRDSEGQQRAEPATASWSEETLEVIITPARKLQSGVTYVVYLGVSDLAGNRVVGLSLSETTFVPSENPANSPVDMRFFPQDGSVDVPVNVSLQILFGRTVLAPNVRLLQNGRVLLTSSRTVTSLLRLQQLLLPNTQYRLQTDAFIDDQGNPITAASVTFTTGGGMDSLPLLFVSSNPPIDAAGVDVDTVWQMTFNKPLSPVWFFDMIFSRTTPFRWGAAVNGSDLLVTPRPAWPAASQVTAILTRSTRAGVSSVSDWTGAPLARDVQLRFRTAALNDRTPPVLESVTPPAGTMLPAGSSTIVLRFSKPVAISDNGLQVFYGANLGTSGGLYSADFRTVTVPVRAPEKSRITIIGSDVRDNADNKAESFVLEYPTSEAVPSGPVSAQMTEPAYNNITPGTGITVRFDRAMVAETVIAAFHVTQDGQNVAGSIDVTENGRTYRFRAAAPFKEGSEVRVFILPSAVDANGFSLASQPFGFAQFTIPVKPAGFNVMQYSFRRTAPADAVLAVEFDGEVDAGTVDGDTVWLRAGKALVPGLARVRDGRVIEFTPAAPLQPGVAYVLTVGAGVRSTEGLAFAGMDLGFKAVAPEAAPEVQTVEWTGREGRRAMHVRFTRAISPVGLRRITGEENEVLLSTAGDELWVIPNAGEAELMLQRLASRSGRTFAAATEVR